MRLGIDLDGPICAFEDAFNDYAEDPRVQGWGGVLRLVLEERVKRGGW